MDDSKNTLANLLKRMREQNKADLLLQASQVKYEKEASGEDNDKREVHLDKANESLQKENEANNKREVQLKNIDETLQKIEKAILGNGDQLKVLPKNLADDLSVKLSKLSVPEEGEGGKTFTESLKELVGSYKSFEQKLADSFDKGFDILSNPLNSMKEGLKNVVAKGKERKEKAIDYVKDVANTPAGATAESIRFTKEYEKQNRQFASGLTREEVAEGKLQQQGQKVFEERISAEKETAAAEANISTSKKYGFAGTPEDTQRLEKAKEAENLAYQKFTPVDSTTPASVTPVAKFERDESKQVKNEEADNVVSAQESIADSLKENNIVIKELLDTTKEQLNYIKNIKESITPKEDQDEDVKNQKKEKFYSNVSNRLEEISGKLDGIGDGGGGGLLGSAGDLLGGRGKTGGRVPGKSSLGSRIFQGGKNLLSKGSNLVKGVVGGITTGGAVAGATTIGAGLALNYGLTKGADALTEAAGADTSVTPDMEAQDEANWKEASFLEKVQSSPARGIEKIGSFLGADKTTAAAKAKRIKNETEFLRGKKAEVKPVETITGQKPVKILSKEKTTSEKVSKQSEEYDRDPKYREDLKKEQDPILDRIVQKPAANITTDNAIIKPTADVAPAITPSRRMGSELSNISTENRDIRDQAINKSTTTPIISNNTNNTNTTSYTPIKSTPRADMYGSPLERYQSRISVY